MISFKSDGLQTTVYATLKPGLPKLRMSLPDRCHGTTKSISGTGLLSHDHEAQMTRQYSASAIGLMWGPVGCIRGQCPLVGTQAPPPFDAKFVRI